jgi:hypothetical protein
MEIVTTTNYEIYTTEMNITHSIAQVPDLFITNGSTTTIVVKTNHVQQTCFITSQQSWVENKLSKQVKTQHAINNFNGATLVFTTSSTASFEGQLGHTVVALLHLSCGGPPCDDADLCKPPKLDGNTSHSPNTHPLVTVA